MSTPRESLECFERERGNCPVLLTRVEVTEDRVRCYFALDDSVGRDLQVAIVDHPPVGKDRGEWLRNWAAALDREYDRMTRGLALP